jgi:hypothetical protein
MAQFGVSRLDAYQARRLFAVGTESGRFFVKKLRKKLLFTLEPGVSCALGLN